MILNNHIKEYFGLFGQKVYIYTKFEKVKSDPKALGMYYPYQVIFCCILTKYLQQPKTAELRVHSSYCTHSFFSYLKFCEHLCDEIMKTNHLLLSLLSTDCVSDDTDNTDDMLWIPSND